LLVQADTLDQPLVVNDGVMLDLGSTAKLRTLATYLEIVASLHDRLAGRSADELRALVASPQVHEHDALTRWVVDRLIARPATTRGELVEAALERRYSASPSERFHTGGGLHRFHNFDPEQNSLHPTVRAAFRDSVNLAFVRIMRDIVYHRMYFDPGVAGQVLADRSHPLRAEYLKTFADREGTRYLDRFYRRYHGKSPDGMLATLLDHTRLTPKRLAMIERATAPELGFDAYQENLAKRLPKWDRDLSAKTIREVYDTYDPARYGLNDQAYLSGTHPLELWLVAYLHENPEATLDEVIAASATARQTAYRWLFRTQHKAVQDARIKTLLEAEAFKTIHSEWQRTGYPFDALVPSYGSALGSSGDRPSALAELMGIILNDGIRRPVQVVERVRFAEGTPYETTLVHAPRDGERVLHSEVAAALREALREPVEHGTGRRANGVLVDRNGRPLVVGGKTGTGDNVSKRFNAEGETIDERVLSRAAAFAFYIHDRYYGVITAYVPGANAADYGFTSSLTTEIFRMLAPVLEPLVERSSEPEPDPGPALVVQAPAVDRASGQCVVARAPVEVPAAEDRSVEAGPADAPTWPSDEGAIVAVPASRSAVAGSLPMDLPLTTGSDPRA
jgi:membrane peptidoglycan carboxypeptidase